LFKAKKLDEAETTKEKRYLAGKLMSEGTFATAKLFKELFTTTYTPKTESLGIVHIKIMEEEFYVPVNKFKPAGTTYSVVSLSTGKGTQRYMHQSTKYTEDHDRFKLFFASALVHNRDSYILNKTILDTGAWNIAIHDALVCHPLAVSSFRTNYAKHLYDMYENREQILTDYRKSIGAVGRKASVLYTRMIQSADPVEQTEFNAMALK